MWPRLRRSWQQPMWRKGQGSRWWAGWRRRCRGPVTDGWWSTGTDHMPWWRKRRWRGQSTAAGSHLIERTNPPPYRDQQIGNMSQNRIFEVSGFLELQMTVVSLNCHYSTQLCNIIYASYFCFLIITTLLIINKN